jgi:MFS family permease
MATPNTRLSAVADTRSPLQKIFSSTNLVLFMVCLMYGLTYIDRINVNTAGPSIQRDLHLSTIQLGWVFSAFGWAYLALQVWGGWLSDKFGARITLTVCGIIWAGSTMLIGLVGSFTALIVCRVILGLREGARPPARWLTPA